MITNLLKKRTVQGTLHPLIQELSRDLCELHDAVVMPAAIYEKWRTRLTALASEEQPAMASHIVALALRMQEILPGRGEAAIFQLARLAHAMMGDPSHVATLFASLGIDEEKLRTALESDKHA